MYQFIHPLLSLAYQSESDPETSSRRERGPSRQGSNDDNPSQSCRRCRQMSGGEGKGVTGGAHQHGEREWSAPTGGGVSQEEGDRGGATVPGTHVQTGKRFEAIGGGNDFISFSNHMVRNVVWDKSPGLSFLSIPKLSRISVPRPNI